MYRAGTHITSHIKTKINVNRDRSLEIKRRSKRGKGKYLEK